MNIFTLFGSIMVDSKEADKSIAKITNNAEGFSKKLGAGIKTAAKWGAAIGAGAAVAGGAMFAMASKTAETTDRIDKLSQKIGLSRQGFAEWEYILSQNGASIEGLQTGMKTLTQRIDEVNNETGKGADLFKSLGLSMADIKGKTQEEVFEKTVAALQGMEDGAKKAALANELFGRSGTELMPLLNGQAGSIEELKKKAQDLGLVIGDDAIDAGVKFTDSLDTVKRMAGALATNFGAELLPIIQKFLDWTIANMPTIKDYTKRAFDVIGEVVTAAYDIFTEYFLPVLKDIYNWISANMPTIKAVSTEVFSAISYYVKNVWDVFKNSLLPILKDLYSFIEPTFPLIKTIIKTAFDSVIEIVKTATAVFQGVIDVIKGVVDWFGRLKDAAAEKIQTSFTVDNSYSDSGYQGLATGTPMVTKSGMFKVGESGPEDVFLPAGSAVTPNGSMAGSVTININDANIMDDYGVDRLMDRIMSRLQGVIRM